MSRPGRTCRFALLIALLLSASLPAAAAEWAEVKRIDIGPGAGRWACPGDQGLTVLIEPAGDTFAVYVSRMWVPQSDFDDVRLVFETADGKRHEALRAMMAGGGNAGDTALRSWLFLNPEGCARDDIRAVVVEQLTAEGIAMAEARKEAHDQEVAQARGECPLPAPAEGKPYPFTLTALDGRKLDSESLKGRVVVLDFWASWCMPCVGEFPAMKALYDKHHADGLEIIGICFDDNLELTRKTLAKHRVPWPQVFIGNQTARQALGKQTGVTSIPRYFVIDREGVLNTDHGRGRLEELVPQLLAQRP